MPEAFESIKTRQSPENYIYISHLENGEKKGLFFIIPVNPESIADSLNSTFQETSALARSAPVYTYSSSGPRTVQFSFTFHRDMMDEVNNNVSNYELGDGEDYVEGLIHALQSIAVPQYNLQNKLVEPPLVAVRISNDIFIKGIVNNGVTANYEKPLLFPDGRYAKVHVQFTVSEVDPYDATTVFQQGSFRGMTRTLADGMGGPLKKNN